MRRILAGAVAGLAVAAAALGSDGHAIRFARPSLNNLLITAGQAAHPEGQAEMDRARDWLVAQEGPVDPDRAQEALLAAWKQAAAVPAGSGALGAGWKEIGPKPYSVDPSYDDPFNGAPPVGVVTESGRVNALAVDPSDARGRKVWAGTAGGGLWESRNGGLSWTPRWDAMPTLAIAGIVFDEARPGTIYVGTGDPAGNGYARGAGVYRSTNGGKTFQRVARNVGGEMVTALAARAGKVYVGTNRGLWRSIDGGNTYHDVKLPTAADGRNPAKGLFSSVVTDVVIHPVRAGEITVAIGNPRGKAGGSINGLFRSTKSGAPGTWKRLATQEWIDNGVTDDPIGRISLAYATGKGQDHDVLWALVSEAGLYNGRPRKDSLPKAFATRLNGVYRSGDDGKTWELKGTVESFASAPGTGLLGLVALYSPGVQASYNQSLAVSPKNADVVVVGLEELYQSVADANTPGVRARWQTIGRYWNVCLYPVNVSCETPAGPYEGDDTIHADQHAVAFNKDGSVMYAGNDGGVFKQATENGAFSNAGWENTNATLGTLQAYYATMSADGTVYAGFQDNGIGKITPEGQGIQTFVGDGGDSAVEPGNSNHAWSEYVGGAVFKTRDGGKTWVAAIPELSGAAFIAPLEMDPDDPNHVVVGGIEVVETIKGIETECRSEFIVTGQHAGPCDWMVSYTLGGPASALDVDGSVIYAAWCGPCNIDARTQAYKDVKYRLSTNYKKGCTPAPGSSACWRRARGKGLPNRYITDVKIDPRNPAVVYATVGGYSNDWVPLDARTPSLGRGNVFMSRDGGDTFTNISANLPAATAKSIEMKGDRLYVGTKTGVYTTAKAGQKWVRLGRGLPNAEVTDVSFNPQGTTLLVATFGRGMWTYPIGGKPARVVEAKPVSPLPSAPVAPQAGATGVSVAGEMRGAPAASRAVGDETGTTAAIALAALLLPAAAIRRARMRAR